MSIPPSQAQQNTTEKEKVQNFFRVIFVSCVANFERCCLRFLSDRADIDKQAEDMFFRLVEQLAEKEGVTEQLKVDNQMVWVARMNNIRNQATEIVNNEIVYNI